MVNVAGVEVSMHVANNMPLGRPLLLTIATINCVATLKVSCCSHRVGSNCNKEAWCSVLNELNKSLQLPLLLVPTPLTMNSVTHR
jgi:hypothetical protein